MIHIVSEYIQKRLQTIRSKSSKGSTIIELLIAVMVVGLIVTAVANAVTYSIKNTGESRFRQVATILGQQVIEFVRSEKNRKGLLNLKNTLTGGDYCFSTIPANLDTTPTNTGVCGASETVTMGGTDFKRDLNVIIGSAPDYSMKITVVVSWFDGDQTREVELIQEFEKQE